MNNNTYELKRDDKVLFKGTEKECYFKLQKIQSQSADWAIRYEGYSVSKSFLKGGE